MFRNNNTGKIKHLSEWNEHYIHTLKKSLGNIHNIPEMEAVEKIDGEWVACKVVRMR